MKVAAAPPQSILEWGWAGRALEGDVSGDLHVVAPFPGGALVALIDGLGHGPEAADAARAAASVLQNFASDLLPVLIQRCHEELHRTRGVVMTLASVRADASSLDWIGIGNVEGVLLRRRGARRRDDAIVLRGGVVGYQLPPLRARAVPVSRGDTLILTTDGVRSGFATSLAIDDAPQEIAESILARHAKGSDDAHVVVARYIGAVP